MTEPHGEVFDLGYRRYEGPREGRMRARKAIWMNGVRTALGIGRGWGSKALPILLFVAVMIPALLISIVASQVDIGNEDLPSHAGYYQIVSIILILFSAIIAPELLCPDRPRWCHQSLPCTAVDYYGLRGWAVVGLFLCDPFSGVSGAGDAVHRVRPCRGRALGLFP